MWTRIKRLFVIKTRFEASLIIYALGLGAIERGLHYRVDYPGIGGWLLLLACTGSVFLAGAKIFDCIRYENDRGAEAQPALGVNGNTPS
ncbi:MAG: hypothetical protein GW859_00020 [Sphingomonadales bacterium]|nr:hypothetical protein [Sphingomonadales bacterium]